MFSATGLRANLIAASKLIKKYWLILILHATVYVIFYYKKLNYIIGGLILGEYIYLWYRKLKINEL